MFDEVSQYNSRYNALYTLTITIHSVKMPIDFGEDGIKRKCRTLASMVQLKRSIIEIGAEENCLSHALIIAIARLNNDPTSIS